MIIIGAGGNIGRQVTHLLLNKGGIQLTLFVRSRRRLANKDLSGANVVEGDAGDPDQFYRDL